METQTIEVMIQGNSHPDGQDANNANMATDAQDNTGIAQSLLNTMKKFFHFWCSFSGRLRRKRFLWQKLLVLAVAALTGIGIAISLHFIQNPILLFLIILCVFLPLLCFVVASGMSLMIRRLQDFNYSIKWLLVFGIIYLGFQTSIDVIKESSAPNTAPLIATLNTLLGILNCVCGIFVLFKRGTQGTNRFGVDPREQTNQQCAVC